MNRLFLLLGGDDYQKSQALEKIKSKFLEKSSEGLNCHVFFAKDADLNEVLESAGTAGFLSKHRVIILKDANKLNASQKSSLASFIDRLPDSCVMVLEAISMGKSDILYKSVSSKGRVVEIEVPSRGQAQNWIAQKARSRGKAIDQQAIRVLLENTGDDLGQIDAAVESLCCFTGDRDRITAGDVAQLVGASLEEDTFKLVDAIGLKNCDEALKILSDFAKQSRYPQEIIGALGWYFRKLRRSRQLRRFSADDIENALCGLVEMDLAQKTTQSNPYHALEQFVIGLCSA